MNKSKHQITIIVYFMVCLFAMEIISCEIPAIESHPTIVLEIEKPDDPGIIIEEEKIIMMKAIEQYPAYAVDESSKVFGLNGNAREVIILKDSEENIHQFTDFFAKNGVLYFTVKVMENGAEEIPETDPVQYVQVEKEYHYQQTGETVAEISELPAKPESTFLTMAEGNFQIIEKDGHSEVIRGTSPTAFVQIDGYFYTPAGLWFSVSETISIRKKGVYFYDNEINLSANPQFIGRVWMM